MTAALPPLGEARNGESAAGKHPEQLAVSQSGRTIAVARPDDTIETVDLLLVVSLKPLPNGTPPRGRRRP